MPWCSKCFEFSCGNCLKQCYKCSKQVCKDCSIKSCDDCKTVLCKFETEGNLSFKKVPCVICNRSFCQFCLKLQNMEKCHGCLKYIGICDACKASIDKGILSEEK
jgi:hypothetical protein